MSFPEGVEEDRLDVPPRRSVALPNRRRRASKLLDPALMDG